MSNKNPLPSRAQAKLLAGLWSGFHRPIPVADRGHGDPTVAACVRRGWLGPTEFTGTYPNGEPFAMHDITDAGIDALTRYLLSEAHKAKVVRP